MTRLFPLLIILCFLSNCADPASQNNQAVPYEALSGKLCACTKPSVKLNERMASFLQKGEKDKFTQTALEASAIFTQAVECSKEALQTQSDKTILPSPLRQHLQTNCPNTPKRLLDDLFIKLFPDNTQPSK